ncbi:hypothetical protein F2Q68_00025763 [Brassica cretica]|uniref:Uncharacterized protein n=1 Tax=Brassica cretica TaxID=69181 RepID=A0A8S9ID60_BRACR|nr:hypothetical protein F2Q68_00025763 [Brassica cretica]
MKMMRQLHAVYGEWLLKDCCWDFVVDNVKGARIRSKVETVSEFREEDDEADECFEDNDDDLVEDENHDEEEDDGEEDNGEEDADISIVAEADENGEDYSVHGKVENEDEEDDDSVLNISKRLKEKDRIVTVSMSTIVLLARMHCFQSCG